MHPDLLLERTREFGMLRTIGMSRWQITFQMLLAALLLDIILVREEPGRLSKWQ